MTASRPTPAMVLVAAERQVVQPAMRLALTARGFAHQQATTAAEARRLARVLEPRMVVLDLDLPEAPSLLAEWTGSQPPVPVLALARPDAAAAALAALRGGARDVLLLPLEEGRLLGALRATQEATSGLATRQPGRLPADRRRSDVASDTTDTAAFIGSSPAMERVHRVIASVARSQATVFITGESGTGKELAALAVHARSARAKGPFIALNCGAIPPDLLESEVFGHMKGSFTGALSDKPGAAAAADGGTLFLDEVCEMALPLQTKLLRFLQTSTIQPVGAVKPRKVDVRIVCATNRDPMEAVRLGQFREDLFYRLYVVPIHMPPLRDRGDDVVEIAEAALGRFAAEEGKQFDGLAPETRAFLRAQDWPGNVRQLLNVMRNAVVLNDGGALTPEMLPLALAGTALNLEPPVAPRPGGIAGEEPVLTLAQIERRAIEAALARHDGSVPKAARELDVSPSTLYRKLESWSNR